MVNTNRRLRDSVRDLFSSVAVDPEGEHPFPVGRGYAERLGYPRNLLDELPQVAVEAFTGLSNLSVTVSITQGLIVLDLGCGSGMDSLIASQRVGEEGRIIGIDFSETMLARASEAVQTAGASNVTLACASAEELPLTDESIHIAIANGIFNLNPARTEIFADLARVLVAGGVVYSAELILKEPLPKGAEADEANWFT